MATSRWILSMTSENPMTLVQAWCYAGWYLPILFGAPISSSWSPYLCDEGCVVKDYQSGHMSSWKRWCLALKHRHVTSSSCLISTILLFFDWWCLHPNSLPGGCYSHHLHQSRWSHLHLETLGTSFWNNRSNRCKGQPARIRLGWWVPAKVPAYNKPFGMSS